MAGSTARLARPVGVSEATRPAEPANGMACSPARWSRPVSAPEATSPARVANAAAAATAALRSRHPQPQRGGDDLEPRGRRPDRLAVDLERKRLRGADHDGGRPQE